MSSASSSSSIPQRLGDFEIVRELGRGGMGVVYEARQLSLNRKVALKVLNGGLGLTGRAVQRFRQEAEAAAKLRHANIVPVYATGEEDGIHYFAMELVEGASLDKVIARKPLQDADTTLLLPKPNEVTVLPEAAGLAADNAAACPAPPPPTLTLGFGTAYFDGVARVIADVADALDHAHKQGVIHRDIKPSNLLLSPDGKVSVNDFGVARMLAQPGMTMTGEVVGTPIYMSPEQIAAGRIPLDHRTDVYSLGATLYELLTLHPPFEGDQQNHVLAQIIQTEPKPPRAWNRQIPRDLETICLKAMDKNPAKRYQAAADMANDLRRFVSRFAISARRTGPLGKATRWVRRHPALSAALGLALVAVLVAGFFAYRYHVAEQEYLAEKRQNAVEKSYVAAMGGDFKAANEAITEAERLGASAWEMHLLNGLVAYYSGKTQVAQGHFEQAVGLMPGSVAAQSLLAMAYSYAGNWAEYEQSLAKAEQLTAVTRDDYLFRGYAEAAADPVVGLRTLDEAEARGQSPIVRLIRAEVLTNLAIFQGGIEPAERAVAEADAAKMMLDDKNATPLWLGLLSRLAAYNAYGKAKDEKRQAAVLTQARKDAQALERFVQIPEVLQARFSFYRALGEEAVVEEELRRGVERGDHPLVAYCYAMVLYRKGEAEKAVAVLAKHQGNTMLDVVRCLFLVELPDGPARARRLCEEIATRDLWGWDIINPQHGWRMLGDGRAAEMACRAYLKKPERFPVMNREHFRLALEYAAGKTSLAEFQKMLRAAPADQCNGQFIMAMVLLSQGEREQALQHFQNCLDSDAFSYLPYDLSSVFRERMKNDPKWPPSIPK